MQKSLRKKYTMLLAVVTVLFTTSVSTTAQDLSEDMPIDPNVTVGEFDNGLKYYIRENHKPEDKVELRLIVDVGSIQEDDNQQGLAHFMEHMNFNGTKNFEKNELVSYLQSIGVEFGADLNANTGFDRTLYILPIPTDKPGNLDKGFQILEDWAHNALLTDEDIDDERGVVLEESRGAKTAQMRMVRKYLPEMMAGSRYAERLPIGKDDILKNFKYKTLRSFYNDWYRPDLMAVVVVGDIDKETAMKYLKKHFEPLKNPKNAPEHFRSPVVPRTESDAMVLTDKEATGYTMQMVFPVVKQGERKTLSSYRQSMVRGLMQQILNQRLRDLARSSDPPYTFAQAGISGLAYGYESLSSYTVFGAGGAEKAVKAVTAEMKKAKEFGFTENELELAKKESMSFIEKAYNERNTMESARLVGEYVRNFHEDEPIPGIENEYTYYQQLMPGITLEEVNGVIEKWMSNTDGVFTVITAPSDGAENLPTDEELKELVAKGFAQDVKEDKKEEVAKELMSEKPTPGTVKSVAKDAEFKSTTYTLSNGAKVTIKPTSFKSDEILLSAVKYGGRNGYSLEDISSADYAAATVDAMGVADFTPSQLEKVLAGKNISISTDVGTYSNTISANSTVKDFETMLQLLHLKLTKPRKDKDLFEAFIKKQKMQVQFISASPQAAFVDTLYKTLTDNNPLANIPIPTAEDFENVDMKRAMEIYMHELGNADGYHFFIVGNIDEKVAKPLIETYIASLPAKGNKPELKDNGVRPIKGNHDFNFYKGQEDKSLIVDITHGEHKYTEDFSLKVSALAEILNIKVIEELREKMSGIYSGRYQASVDDEPYNNYQLVLYLPCGSENVEKLLTAADEVVKNIQANGPAADDLEKVKKQWHEKHKESLEKNGYWLGKMQSVMFWDKSKDNVFEYDAWIDSITAKDIQNVAKEVFNNGHSFTAVLYPESAKK